jgi:hypothetical protein
MLRVGNDDVLKETEAVLLAILRVAEKEVVCDQAPEFLVRKDPHRAIQREKALDGARPSPQPSPQGEGASNDARPCPLPRQREPVMTLAPALSPESGSQ